MRRARHGGAGRGQARHGVARLGTARPGTARRGHFKNMIHRDGFLKGDVVEFQSYNHCWIQGTVMQVEPAEQRVVPPGSGHVVETAPSRIHVKYFDSARRADRVILLPKKRVRHAAGSA